VLVTSDAPPLPTRLRSRPRTTRRLPCGSRAATAISPRRRVRSASHRHTLAPDTDHVDQRFDAIALFHKMSGEGQATGARMRR